MASYSGAYIRGLYITYFSKFIVAFVVRVANAALIRYSFGVLECRSNEKRTTRPSGRVSDQNVLTTRTGTAEAEWALTTVSGWIEDTFKMREPTTPVWRIYAIIGMKITQYVSIIRWIRTRSLVSIQEIHSLNGMDRSITRVFIIVRVSRSWFADDTRGWRPSESCLFVHTPSLCRVPISCEHQSKSPACIIFGVDRCCNDAIIRSF